MADESDPKDPKAPDTSIVTTEHHSGEIVDPGKEPDDPGAPDDHGENLAMVRIVSTEIMPQVAMMIKAHDDAMTEVARHNATVAQANVQVSIKVAEENGLTSRVREAGFWKTVQDQMDRDSTLKSKQSTQLSVGGPLVVIASLVYLYFMKDSPNGIPGLVVAGAVLFAYANAVLGKPKKPVEAIREIDSSLRPDDEKPPTSK